MPRPQVARPRVFHLSAAAKAHKHLTCQGEVAQVFEWIEADVADVHWVESLLGYAYVFAGLLFVVGSVYFLPSFSAYVEAGCYLYLVGGVIYFATSLFDMEEASHVSHRFEVMMNFLYLVGSVFFNGATVLYIPEVSSRLGSETAGRYGSGGFIIGSALFIFACFLNGAHTGDAFSGGSKDARLAKVSVLATTNATMFGSCLFLVGSVLYMPDLGCAEETAVYGTYCYLWGSVAFVVAGVLPLLRTRKVERLQPPPLDTAKSAAHYVLV